ncbi:hypothetical protein [Brevibacterium moorei]|uniref:hypothetical protein n=1 Tax=Brevibacterium moorei TaxID=2968457 RepID=UPI00211B86D1|nr:hypothetical protein [Brevibacterium sp. 68QC2CO]MCQ9385150.1 hypothetical protein [Brevibacterium sp. 68QC2CO]
MKRFRVTSDMSTSYRCWEGEAEDAEAAEELFWDNYEIVEKGSDYGAEVEELA